MLPDGIASPEDIIRWEAALQPMDSAEIRPTIFVPNFIAIGRPPPIGQRHSAH